MERFSLHLYYASKQQNGTGEAIYDPTFRFHDSKRLRNNFSIFNAEIYGIYMTLKYCQ